MPSPSERMAMSKSERVARLMSAAKAWNSSYWTELSWTDVGKGVGKTVGHVALSAGVNLASNAVKTALVIDPLEGLGALASIVRAIAGNGDDLGNLGAAVVESAWDRVSDVILGHEKIEALNEKLDGAYDAVRDRVKLTAAQRKARDNVSEKKVRGYDAGKEADAVKALLMDAVLTLAKLRVQVKPNNIHYCDDIHEMWTQYYRIKKDINELKAKVARLASFANKCKEIADRSASQLQKLEADLKKLTEDQIDDAKIPHYAGNLIAGRSSQCGSTKCFGKA